MANIDEYIKQIQQAQYGEEVRGSIVNALKKVNDDNNSYVAIKKEVVAAKDIVEEKANAAKETLTALQASTQIANEAKSSLNNIISSAISTKKELEQAVLETGEVIARVDNAKSNLDKSITSAGKAELNLQRQIETSNQIKNQLDVSNNTAIELKKNLDVAINEANTAKVKLVEAINNAGNAALEKIETAQSVATRAVETAKVEAVKAITTAGTTETEKVTAEGTKQVGLVKTEGEKQVQAVQTAAQEIITDREQINTNKEGVAQLKEDLEQLKQNGTGTGTGLSAEIKSALMAVVENIGLWKDGNGQTYIDNLRTALYNAPLSSISAVYTQSKTVYPTDDLDVLKEDLVVTGMYTDGSSAIVTDYTLSGSLLVGTSTITVTKDGKNTTFEVTVAETRVPATGITLNNTTLSFTGSTPIQLTATVEPLNSTDTVVWSSSENAVATVENGLVTPVSDGSCKIYATAGDITVECSVSVALPLNGINIGNPFLTKVDGMPSSVAMTEEEAQGKWYKALFTAWTNALSIEKIFFLHPLTNGTYYIRMVGRTLSDPIEFYAFQNADIGLNPTATLGKVGGEYTNATVTKFITFDSEYTNLMGNVDLGEWTYVDNSGTTYTSSMVVLYKVVVPENVYVFMATSEMGANRFPGISDAHPYMNDLYTIFDSDPSSNILQIVE